MRGKKIMIMVAGILLLSSLLPVFSNGMSMVIESDDEIHETINVMDAGLELSIRGISDEDLEYLMQREGVTEGEPAPTPIVNGMGTGLTPPTYEGWQDIQQDTMLIESVSSMTPMALNTSKDLSSYKYFPPIGNQGGEGSCCSWSIGYYTKTFQEAKEHNWNLSGAGYTGSWPGYPTVSYQDRIMSPEFLYHQVNNGQKLAGSYYHDNINVCKRTGISSWKNMPYSDTNSSSWPSEDAWREAPKYRTKDTTYYMYVDTDTKITNLKTWIDGDNLATISIDAGKYSSLSSTTGGDLWTNATNCVQSRNHANTIVGYDDNFGPYTEDSTTRYGAFKIANSWSKGWGGDSDSDGMYWISYRAMRDKVDYVFLMTDRIDYNPEIVSVFNISHNYKSDCQITLGIGSTSSPTSTKRFDDYTYRGGLFPFENNLMVFDITDFSSSVSNYYGQNYFLKVTDGGQTATGSIQHFSVEHYDDFLNGSKAMSATSTDPIVSTTQGGSVYAEVVLKDSEYPKLVSDETPSSATTGDMLNFSAVVTDNTEVYGVWLEYWIGTGPHSNVSCSEGSSDSWYYNTTAPNLLDTIHYIFHFNDTSGYWNHTTEKTLSISDNDLPVLDDSLMPDTVSTGDDVEFVVKVTDNIGVSSVSLEYWIDTGSPVNGSMTDQGSDTYSSTVTMPTSSGVLHVIIHSADSSSNWNQTDEMIYLIEDNDSPEFSSDNTPAIGYTGDELTFSILILDNVLPHTAWVEYWYEGSPHTNSSMSQTGPGLFELTIVIDDTLSNMSYIFRANDTSNNWNTSDGGVVMIMDNDVPVFISDLSDTQAFTGDPFTFEVEITDNIGMIDGEVYLNYSIAGIFRENISMTTSGLDLWSYDVVLPMNETGYLEYWFFAVDGSVNWNGSGPFSVWTNDNDAPSLVEDLSNTTAYTGEVFNLWINATDNIGVHHVSVEYWFGNESAVNLTLFNPIGSIWTDNVYIPHDSLMDLCYRIWITDTSDLVHVTDISCVTVEDSISPMILGIPGFIQPTTGDTLTVDVSVADNIGISMVVLYYRIGSGENFSMEMAHLIAGAYRANISIPHELSILNISFIVYDLSNNSFVSDIMSYNITDNDAPHLPIFDDMNYTSGDHVMLNSTGSWDNIGIESYNWTILGPEVMYFNTSQIAFNITVPGNYTVMLKITDGSGNFNNTDFRIDVEELLLPSIEFQILIEDDNVTLMENLSIIISVKNTGNVNISVSVKVLTDLDDEMDEFQPFEIDLPPGLNFSYPLEIPAYLIPAGDHFITITVSNLTNNISITRTIDFLIWDEGSSVIDDDDIVDDDDVVDDDDTADDDIVDDDVVDDDTSDDDDDTADDDDSSDTVSDLLSNYYIPAIAIAAGILLIAILLLFMRRKKDVPEDNASETNNEDDDVWEDDEE